MFVEIRENVFVNLEQVKQIKFIKKDIAYTGAENYWVFVLEYADESTEYWNGEHAVWSENFPSREEALKWFEENIKPALNDYNHAKFNL